MMKLIIVTIAITLSCTPALCAQSKTVYPVSELLGKVAGRLIAKAANAAVGEQTMPAAQIPKSSSPKTARWVRTDSLRYQRSALPAITYPEPTIGQSIPDAVSRQIRAKAEREWPGDFNMQKFVIEEQAEAYEAVKRYSNPSVPSGVLRQIMDKAEREWPTDFNMQKFVIEEQVSAYRDLNR